jgi:lipid II:glycine glycyltransferase (peptidoglycan interpeptide bridge formation enzyme)
VATAPGGTYQQTSMWAQVKSLAEWRPVRITLSRDGAVVAGCQVLVRRVAWFGPVAYVPYGPLAADGDAATVSAMLDALQQLVR